MIFSIVYCSRLLSKTLGDVVEVVLILDESDWNQTAIDACERARKVTDQALRDLPCFALPICRTRTEHDSFKERERGLWVPLDFSADC